MVVAPGVFAGRRSSNARGSLCFGFREKIEQKKHRGGCVLRGDLANPSRCYLVVFDFVVMYVQCQAFMAKMQPEFVKACPAVSHASRESGSGPVWWAKGQTERRNHTDVLLN